MFQLVKVVAAQAWGAEGGTWSINVGGDNSSQSCPMTSTAMLWCATSMHTHVYATHNGFLSELG